MKTPSIMILALLSASNAMFAAPAITGVVNSASLLPPGMPNGAIGQGSIFNIFGSGLGPATIVAAPFPLPTNLGGTTVSVTVGSTTVQAPMFYSLAAQLAAILPSNTPVGTGTVTVNFGGASATSAITVVSSNVGIYTADQSGRGQGVVTFADYSPLSATKTAKSGDALIIWATGLGPISTSDANPPEVLDLGTPLSILVGGIATTPFYRGRSGYAGLDQINFFVPAGVSPGCGVSLVIRTGNLVSNTTTIPVSGSGEPCSDANSIFSLAQATPLLAKSSIKIGTFQYTQAIVNTFKQDGNTVQTNGAGAILIGLEHVYVPILQSQLATVTPGSCDVSVIKGEKADGQLFSVASLLNAGANLRLSQPNGSVATLASSGGTGGQYAANLNLYQPGVFTMSGAGGPDVGAFSVPFTVPPALTWSNLDVTSGSVIDRTQPLSIRWTGGDPLGFVDVYVRAGLDNSDVQVIADCAAPVSAGSVSIPASVLLALPAPASLATVTIVGGNSPVFLPVPVPGMDGVIVQVSNSVQVTASLK